ncbi:MAG: response regulator [Bacteroidales bacterium]|nr:response regulator [Bacteroidales bacterium]
MDDFPKILLVEDNENDIELTLTALEDNNLANRVDVVRNGVEAMEYLLCEGKYKNKENQNPIVILLDIKMPKMDGQQVLKKIKSNEALSSIPVVMLTSSNLDKDIIESYSAGVNAYVVKPIDFTEFQNAVKNLGIFWALINNTTK